MFVRPVGNMDTDRQIHLCTGSLGGARKELEGHGCPFSGHPEKDVFVMEVFCETRESSIASVSNPLTRGTERGSGMVESE